MSYKAIKACLAAATMLGATAAAQAADIPVRPPVYKGQPIVAYYNWTGFYAGISGGYGFGDSTWSSPVANPKPTGYLIGGTVGYNWQSGALVYGLEGDWSWANITDSVTCGVASTCETKNTWLATFRGRLGYAFDRWLPYITAGGAYGNVQANTTTAGVVTSASNANFGWTIGAGLEYAFAGNWSAKLEYLYVDLGSFNSGVAPATNNVTLTENIIRAGLNYRFSGPIFSRY